MKPFKKSTFKTISTETFLNILIEFGLKTDMIGGKKEPICFSIFEKINKYQYKIDTNHKTSINFFSIKKFNKTISKIESKTKVKLFQ